MSTDAAAGTHVDSARCDASTGPRAQDATPRRLSGLRPQDLVHRLAPSELVDELVEVADLLHQRVLDVLDADPADHTVDRGCLRVEVRVGEEVLERRAR